MDWLFGSVEDQAEREYQSGAYTPGKGRKKDWGDHIGDFLTGNRGAAIDRAVEQQHVKKLTRDKGILLGELNAQPNVNIGPITKDTDELVLDQQIAVAKPKAQAYKEMKAQAAAQGVLLDPTEITDVSSGYAFIKDTVDKEKEAERLKLKGEAAATLRESRDYQAGLVKAANARADGKEERMLIREDRKDARARLETLELRKDNMALRADEMKFKYAQLAQQERMNAKDKKDRAMMALISGLGNLGAAMTV